MSQTRVFVSSTCYDLIQIRQSLNTHVKELGHLPVMSEFSSFRVNPQISTLDNCRSNVRANADVFVLIIGGRRGSVDQQSGRSIVNLEYDAAVEQGLDTYVFVDQAVLTLLPIWRKNPDADLTPTIDSPEILKFVDRIQREQRWTYPFTKEADIFDILSTQLSIQFRELMESRRSGHLVEHSLFRDENESAKRLIQSREPFWEYLLTAELLDRRISTFQRKRDDVKAGRVLGAHRTLKGREYMRWVQDKFPEIQCALDKAAHVMTEDVTRAWGPQGVPGKSPEILAAVRQLESALDALLELESDVFRTHGPTAAEPVREVLIGVTDDVFNPIAETPKRLRELVEAARNHKESDGPTVFNLKVKFDFSRGPAFQSAIKQMAEQLDPEEW